MYAWMWPSVRVPVTTNNISLTFWSKILNNLYATGFFPGKLEITEGESPKKIRCEDKGLSWSYSQWTKESQFKLSALMWCPRDKNELAHIGTRNKHHLPEKVLSLVQSFRCLYGEIIPDIPPLHLREQISVIYTILAGSQVDLVL